MFCRNCGTELPENSKFCSNCGAPTGFVPPAEDVKDTVAAPVEEMKEAVEQAVPVGDDAHTVPPAEEIKETAPVGDDAHTVPQQDPAQGPQPFAPVPPTYPADAPAQEPPKKNSGLLPLLIALGAVLVVVALVACLLLPKLFGGKNSSSIAPIDHLFAFINDGDADDLFAALQPEFIEALAEEAGMNTETAKLLIAQSIRSAMTSYADGTIKASYVVEGSEPLEADELDELRYELEYYYGIDSSKLTEAVEYDLETTLIFGTETEIESEDFISYCYNGGWYIWLF